MPPRFVIQKHTTDAGAHYDLMLEAGQALATWRIDRLPQGLKAGESIPAEALGDHRLAYLTYQGELTGGRGRVRIVDRGDYRLLGRGEGRWSVALSGRRARGRFELRRVRGSRWRLSACAAPA